MLGYPQASRAEARTAERIFVESSNKLLNGLSCEPLFMKLSCGLCRSDELWSRNP